MDNVNHNKKNSATKRIAAILKFKNVQHIEAFAQQKDQQIEQLPFEYQQFVRLYKQWLLRFYNFIAERNKPFNEIAAKRMKLFFDESKLWKKHLEVMLNEPRFKSYFLAFQ